MATSNNKNKTKRAIEAAERRAQIASMYLQKETQTNIALKLGISQQAVSKHLIELQKEWRESAFADIEKAKAEQIAAIDHTERKFNEGWERSLSNGRDGNPQFLLGILKCVSKRSEIIGLNAPTKIESDTSLTKGHGLVGLYEEAKRVVAEQGFVLYEIPERDEQ